MKAVLLAIIGFCIAQITIRSNEHKDFVSMACAIIVYLMLMIFLW